MHQIQPTIVNAKASMPIVGRNNPGPKEALESYTRDELGEEELIAALVYCCRTDCETTSQALSLLDQYHRRGLLATCVFLTAKTELHLLMFIAQPSSSNDVEDRSSAATALDQFSSGVFDVKKDVQI
jgi:hypothetical protein